MANPLLECLGEEELIIHKKKTFGPVYYLNQKFINQFASFSDITIKKKYLKIICQNPDLSPSVALLKTILLEGMNIYEVSDDKFKKAQETSTIESFLSTVPTIFFSYLAKLQNLSSTPDCLLTNIKYLKYFTDNIFYLESEFSAKELLKHDKKLKSLFEELKNLDKIWAKCQKEALDPKTNK
jgi:hypothetical protein